MCKVKVGDHKRQNAKNNSIYSTRPGICNVCPEMSTNGYFMPEIETLEGRQVIKHLFLKVELFNEQIWRAPLGPRIVNLHEENVCFSQIIFAKHEDILLRDYAPNTKLRKLGISKW